MSVPAASSGQRARRIAIGAAASIALVAGACVALDEIEARREVARGARAFDGRVPLVARIDGHASALPGTAAACANCHLPSARPAGTPDPARGRDASGAPGFADASASFGPILDREGLTARVPRRGGPPSRFDERAFCRLLRTGEDPAGVLLPRAMPRYEIDAAACDALWRFLNASP